MPKPLPASHLERYADGSSGMIEPSTKPEIRFEEVTPDNWQDFETLFEGKGGPKNCWSMVWRALPGGSRGDKAAKKQAIKDRILEKQPVGLLGYRGTEPFAWCSVAPRDTYRPLGGLDDDDRVVWSLVCMFLKSEMRGVGIGKQLIRAAAEHSRRRGADILEAYPVDPESPSYRFMGFVPMFKELGFTEVGQAGSRRHVMRLGLR
jgi:GNAT superfamily N-acetyltransferase